MPSDMNSKNVQDILKKVKNERRGGSPHDVWVKRNREVLLMQVRNTTGTVRPSFAQAASHAFSIFFPTEGLLMVGRAMAAFILVVGAVFGGGLVSAQVYSDALPGQLMYRVKLSVERAQLMLAPNEDYRTRLHTEFADNRIEEISNLAEAPTAQQTHVPVVLAKFDAEVRALQSGLEKLKASNPDHVVEVAKLMERKMAIYQSILRKSSATLPASAHPAIARSRDLVDGATISAIAVIVEKHLAGASDAPAAVVVNKFEERLRQAEAKIASTPEPTGDTAPAAVEKTAKAKAAIAEAKVLIKEEHYEAALSKIAEVAELTKDEEVTPDPTVTPAEAGAQEEGAEAEEPIPTEVTPDPQPTSDTVTP